MLVKCLERKEINLFQLLVNNLVGKVELTKVIKLWIKSRNMGLQRKVLMQNHSSIPWVINVMMRCSKTNKTRPTQIKVAMKLNSRLKSNSLNRELRKITISIIHCPHLRRRWLHLIKAFTMFLQWLGAPNNNEEWILS